jgi:hypothetical protein
VGADLEVAVTMLTLHFTGKEFQRYRLWTKDDWYLFREDEEGWPER